MPHCAVIGCFNTSKPGRKKVSFHRFPLKQPHIAEQWLKNLNRPGFVPNENSYICGEHFEKDCFEPDMFSKYGLKPKAHTILKPGSIPTLFTINIDPEIGQRKRSESPPQVS